MGERRTLLLVGAGGFLGRHLGAAAAAAGLDLVAAGRHPNERTAHCDLLDPASVHACLEATRPDLVVNAAGAASVARSWEQPAATFAANALGVLNLLEAAMRAAPAAHVLCLSSADVYGVRERGELPLAEELTPEPVTPYGASKAAMETVCAQYARAHGQAVAVARVFNLIGPGQSERFAVPGFARAIAVAEQKGESGVELSLGNGGAVRDFLDVRDGARALLEISRRGLSGTFNLCSGEGATVAELVEELAASARVPVTVRHEPSLERPADPPLLVGDPRRLRAAVGFEPSVPRRRTLGDLLDSWRVATAAA